MTNKTVGTFAFSAMMITSALVYYAPNASADQHQTPIEKAQDVISDAWEEGKELIAGPDVSKEELEGAEVYSHGKKEIGSISNVITDSNGDIEAVIVDVGGFLGIGAKPVAVDFSTLKTFREKDGELAVLSPFTKEQLEQAETYNPKTFKDAPARFLLK